MLSELMSVIHVWIVVFGDHHSVGKLASGESLHGFLTVCSRNVFHKDLQRETSQSSPEGHEDERTSDLPY